MAEVSLANDMNKSIHSDAFWYAIMKILWFILTFQVFITPFLWDYETVDLTGFTGQSTECKINPRPFSILKIPNTFLLIRWHYPKFLTRSRRCHHTVSVNSSTPEQNGCHFIDNISDAFSWMKSFIFWLKFLWSLFWTNADLIHWQIYESLGGDEFKTVLKPIHYRLQINFFYIRRLIVIIYIK